MLAEAERGAWVQGWGCGMVAPQPREATDPYLGSETQQEGGALGLGAALLQWEAGLLPCQGESQEQKEVKPAEGAESGPV